MMLASIHRVCTKHGWRRCASSVIHFTLTLSVWRRRHLRQCTFNFYFRLSASCLQRGSGMPSPGWAVVKASAVETMYNVSACRRTAIGCRRGNTAVVSASSADMIECCACSSRHDLRRFPDQEGFSRIPSNLETSRRL